MIPEWVDDLDDTAFTALKWTMTLVAGFVTAGLILILAG